MLNKEKCTSEIVEIAIESDGIGMVNNKLAPCSDIYCPECDWYGRDCYKERVRWANSEYIEPPKLTSEERRFCEYIKTGYIARDKFGGVYWYTVKPRKEASEWDCSGYAIWMKTLPNYPQFEFITWEDSEPWAVEDLLKLEVEEC